MENSIWKEKFGELNLHGKIVGDKCIDWAHDHQLVIATNKKVVVCDMSMLISSNKTEEIGFMIEDVPVINEKKQFVAETPKFLEAFENACAQTSNTKAAPNYDVYQFFMDPALYQGKLNEFKGYKSVKFSHPLCTSSTETEILAVLSLDYSLGVYHKISAGKHGKWLLLCDLTSSLIDYLVTNSDNFPNFEMKQGESEFEVYREKKHTSCINNMAWSDIYTFLNQQFCYLAASTLNGFIVIWKFFVNDEKQFNPQIVDIFATKWTNVAKIAWLRNVSNDFQQDGKTLGLVMSNCEGKVSCRRRFLTLTSDCDWTNCLKANLWDDEDRLAARHLEWVNYQDKSLLVASKSHVLAAWLLNDNLEVLSEYLLQDAHCMPIVCLNLFEKDMQIQCYSSSSDGVIAEIDIKVFPELHLNVNNLLGKPEDIGSLRVISPATLHETAVSPNKAFMIMLTSRGHVRLSIQVDNEASIFLKRLISPQEAAEKLLQIVSSDTDANLYKYLDLVEITSQHYAMKQKFEPLLEDFLSQTDFKQETDLKKLQLRWYLLKLKRKANRCSKRTSLVDEMRPVQFPGEEESRLVEEILMIRQMTKALISWYYHSADHLDTSLPVVPLLKVLATKEDFLKEKEIELFRNMRTLTALNNLPVQQTCAFTGLPAEISSDCKSASSIDGSTWPICCLTFNLLQGYEKRKCELSGLFSAFTDKDNPRWFNDLLISPCIFSGAPLRRYIN